MHKGAERGRGWDGMVQVQLLTDRQSGFQLGWHERRVEQEEARARQS